MSPEIRNAIKAGLWTALFSFITLFGLALVGWLQDVMAWASEEGAGASFPDFTTLGYAAASAATSAVIGLVNGVVRSIQAVTGKGTVPSYDTQS